jgi:pimeloyl-ACP methyl ester carboxylesterase
MVERIVCVETLGIISKPAESAPTTLREAIRQRATLVEVMRKGLGKEKEGGREGGRGVGSKVYATVEAAVEARLSTVGRLPGAQTLEPSSAAILVGRGAGPAEAPHASDLDLHEGGREGGVRFRHDQRLAASAHIYLTEEQSRAFLAASRCPVLLLRGAEGWPAASPEEEIMREAALGERLTMLKVPGSHHLHLDESTCTEEGVVKPVVRFLTEGAGVQV